LIVESAGWALALPFDLYIGEKFADHNTNSTHPCLLLPLVKRIELFNLGQTTKNGLNLQNLLTLFSGNEICHVPP